LFSSTELLNIQGVRRGERLYNASIASHMKIKFFISIFFLVAAAFAQSPPSTGKHPFTFEDMMKLKRLDGPVPSPDGKWVVFSATDVDLEANTKISHLWIVPASGGPAEAGRRLNETPNHEERPRFSPDGKRLIWTSKATDPSQIWMCDFETESGRLVGQPHQVTSISTGADGAIWSPDGKNIVFVSSVYPDCNPPPPGSGVTSDDCNKKRDDELKNNKVKAKIFTKLFYRHWNAFTEFKRSHLFVVSADANLTALSSQVPQEPSSKSTALSSQVSGAEKLNSANEPRDLTPGDHDVPLFHLGGQDMYAISPDGQELAYTSNIDEVEATSTNNEIFVVPISVESAVPGGKSTAQPRKISTSPGADSTPLYSPDGKYLAWRSQARAGFEADKWSLILYDRASGKLQNRTEKLDLSIGSFAWHPIAYKGTYGIAFTAEKHGNSLLYGLPWSDSVQDLATQALHADDLAFAPNGQLYFTNMSVKSPAEIWHYDLGFDTSGMAMVAVIPPQSVTHM
jgi:dipeptidyl aminopeptidase/acylaminoacyl peptidase